MPVDAVLVNEDEIIYYLMVVGFSVFSPLLLSCDIVLLSADVDARNKCIILMC